MRDDLELSAIRETDAKRAGDRRVINRGMNLSSARRDSDHRDAEAWFEYGFECETIGDLNEALRAYQKAIAIDPQYAEAHFNLGNVLRERRRVREAEQHFRLAAHLNDRFTDAWYNLADVLEERGEIEEAIACLNRVLALDPLYADAHFNLAQCQEAAGDFTVAAHHWARYLMLDSHSAWAAEARRSLARRRPLAHSCTVTSPSRTGLQPPAT